VSINNLGGLLQDSGDLDGAAALYHEALTARRHELGDTHPDTLISINNLGGLLHEKGELPAAAKLYHEALYARRETLGDRHPRTITSINNLGAWLGRPNPRRRGWLLLLDRPAAPSLLPSLLSRCCLAPASLLPRSCLAPASLLPRCCPRCLAVALAAASPLPSRPASPLPSLPPRGWLGPTRVPSVCAAHRHAAPGAGPAG
jgi:hypothetical protein